MTNILSTHEANTFSIYTICKDTSSLTETQNKTTLSSEGGKKKHTCNCICTIHQFSDSAKVFQWKKYCHINFGYTVADLQHLYFLGF